MSTKKNEKLFSKSHRLDSFRCTVQIRSENGTRKVTIISESGRYHALLKSRKPQAPLIREYIPRDLLGDLLQIGIERLTQKKSQPSPRNRHHPDMKA